MKKGYITGSKDTDYVLLQNMGDKELFQTMLINKDKLNLGQKFFEERLRERYPSLIKFKNEKETWANYYLRMIHYISKLKEEYNLDYPRKFAFESPRRYLKTLRKNFRPEHKFFYPIFFAVSDNDEKKLFNLLDDIVERKDSIEEETGEEDKYYFQEAVEHAIVSGNIPLYLKIREKYKNYEEFFDHISEYFYEIALESGDKATIDYIFEEYKEKHPERFQEFIINVLDKPTFIVKDFSKFKYIKENYPEEYKVYKRLF
jgi:hypothetical protein